jgi:hypothetical protein
MDAYGTTTQLEVRRAELSDLDPTAAIHSFCRWCNDADPVSGWVDCHSDTCPLFEFRPGPWQADSSAAKPAACRVIATKQRLGTLGTRPRTPLFRVISCRRVCRAGLTAVSAPGTPQRTGWGRP